MINLALSNESVERTCSVIWETALEERRAEYWDRAARSYHSFWLASRGGDQEMFFRWLHDSAIAMAWREAGL